MQFDVAVGDEDVHCALEETFRAVIPEEEEEDGRGRMEVPREDAISKTTARDDDDND